MNQAVSGQAVAPVSVLLLEDDQDIARLVVEGLGAHNFIVFTVATLAAARDWLANTEPDILLLDLMLPDGSGLEIAAEVRDRGSRLPICMLTARDALDDKLSGFSQGADDYVTKPFAMEELVMRLQALVKRSLPAIQQRGRLSAGDLLIDPDARGVQAAGVPLKLTRREFDVLVCLVQKKGTVVSRNALLDAAWSSSRDVNQNTVDVYVSYVRKKLQATPTNVSIETVRGVGFKLLVIG